jgi:hypothetical protein
MSMHEETCAARDSGVRAALEKYLEPVQPPSEMLIRSSGCFALSCLSWFRLPDSGWPATSAVPSTLCAAVKGRW